MYEVFFFCLRWDHVFLMACLLIVKGKLLVCVVESYYDCAYLSRFLWSPAESAQKFFRFFFKAVWTMFSNEDYRPAYLRNSMALRSVRFGVQTRKLSNVGQLLDGWPKMFYLELLCAFEDTLSRSSRLHLQLLAPTNPHWVHVLDYGPFFLCVIRKEGLCLSNGDINRLMMMMMIYKPTSHDLSLKGQQKYLRYSPRHSHFT
jgi:hypothetical protein